MRSIAYTRYNGEDLDISAEDLMKALADFLLDSGFNDPYFQYGANTLDDLRNAIEYAMANGDLGDRIRDQYEGMSPEQIEQALDRMVQKLLDEGYVQAENQGGQGRGEVRAEVKVTDKSVDFLGFKTLKDLMGSLGRASFGETQIVENLAALVDAVNRARPSAAGPCGCWPRCWAPVLASPSSKPPSNACPEASRCRCWPRPR